MRSVSLSLAIFIGSLLSGCDNTPDLLIDEETYKQLFIEITMLNHIDEKSLHLKEKEELTDMVFEHYQVTREMFRFSHNYYEADIEAQLKRMDEVSLLLRNERDKVIELEKIHESENRESLDSLRQRILNR